MFTSRFLSNQAKDVCMHIKKEDVGGYVMINKNEFGHNEGSFVCGANREGARSVGQLQKP